MSQPHKPSPKLPVPEAVAKIEAVKARVFVGIAAGLILFFLIFWYAMDVFLLVFASILMGIFLSRLAGFAHKHLRIRYGAGLMLVLFLLGLIGLLAAWLLIPEVSSQVETLSEQIPQSWGRLLSQIERLPWMKRLITSALGPSQGGQAAVSAIPTILSKGGTILGAAIFVLFCGVFLALEPATYLNNFIRLFPVARRDRLRQILRTIGDSLAGWLVAQLILMVVVGSLTTLGLWLLRMPLALTLGLFTALLLFIPYTGAIVSAIPAILIALLQGVSYAFYIVLLYLGAHIVEAYVAGPILQKKVMKLPPALTLSFQVLMGVLGGIPGIGLSTPTAAMLVVIVRMAYVEDVLQDR